MATCSVVFALVFAFVWVAEGNNHITLSHWAIGDQPVWLEIKWIGFSPKSPGEYHEMAFNKAIFHSKAGWTGQTTDSKVGFLGSTSDDGKSFRLTFTAELTSGFKVKIPAEALRPHTQETAGLLTVESDTGGFQTGYKWGYVQPQPRFLLSQDSISLSFIAPQFMRWDFFIAFNCVSATSKAFWQTNVKEESANDFTLELHAYGASENIPFWVQLHSTNGKLNIEGWNKPGNRNVLVGDYFSVVIPSTWITNMAAIQTARFDVNGHWMSGPGNWFYGVGVEQAPTVTVTNTMTSTTNTMTSTTSTMSTTSTTTTTVSTTVPTAINKANGCVYIPKQMFDRTKARGCDDV